MHHICLWQQTLQLIEFVSTFNKVKKGECILSLYCVGVKKETNYVKVYSDMSISMSMTICLWVYSYCLVSIIDILNWTVQECWHVCLVQISWLRFIDEYFQDGRFVSASKQEKHICVYLQSRKSENSQTRLNEIDYSLLYLP